MGSRGARLPGLSRRASTAGADHQAVVDLQSIHDTPEDSLLCAPSFFQQAIERESEFRLSVFGDEVFCAFYQPGEQVFDPAMRADWRILYSQKKPLEYAPTDRLKACVRSYAKLADLRTLTLDVAPRDSDYVFFEANPEGQWGWLDKQGTYAAAMADLLDGIIGSSRD